MKRLFIALKPGKETLLRINDVRSRFKDEKINWYGDIDIHSTLVRPWNEKDPESIKEKLLQLPKVFDPGKENICVNYVSVEPGPNPEKPTLLWALGEANSITNELYDKLNEIIFGQKEQRPYLAHITLGRKMAGQNISTDIQLDIDWKIETDTIYVIESLKNRIDKRYETLFSISLKGEINDNPGIDREA